MLVVNNLCVLLWQKEALELLYAVINAYFTIVFKEYDNYKLRAANHIPTVVNDLYGAFLYALKRPQFQTLSCNMINFKRESKHIEYIYENYKSSNMILHVFIFHGLQE